MPQPAQGSTSPGSQEVDLPQPARDLVLRRFSCFNLLGDLPVQGSQEVDMPQPTHEPNSQETDLRLDLPRDLISRRWSCLSLLGDLHPDLGMPDSQVATVLGRISFRKTHP